MDLKEGIELIDKWAADGQMTPERILARLNEGIKQYSGLNEDEQTELRKNFDSISTTDEAGTKCVNEATFISYLDLPPSLAAAGHILYRSIYYLSNVPFHQSGPPQSITYDELVRGLAWLLPERAERFTDASDDSRARTSADHRRLIFQSLATSYKNVPFDTIEAKQLAARNAFEIQHGSVRAQFAAVNHDRDGDEMYHDILDVLFSTQLIQIGPYAQVTRDSFRPLAKRMHRDVKLHHLRIPREEFKALVKLLLVSHFASDGRAKVESHQLQGLDNAADSVASAFCQNADVGITWPMFDSALTTVAPLLFDSLYRLISTSFLGKIFSDSITFPPIHNENILTLPALSQLGIFLSETVDFESLRLLHHYSLSNKSTTSTLLHDINAAPDSAILVISGNLPTGEKSVFGCYTPFPVQDAAQIQPREQGYWERCLLFQLSPVHDIFRGTVGQQGWVVAGKDIRFGTENGASLVLKDGLQGAEFSHKVDGPNGEETYHATKRRGNWAVEFEIQKIEVWGEVE